MTLNQSTLALAAGGLVAAWIGWSLLRAIFRRPWAGVIALAFWLFVCWLYLTTQGWL